MNQWFSAIQPKSEVPVECLSVFKQACFPPFRAPGVANNFKDCVSGYRFGRFWRKNGL